MSKLEKLLLRRIPDKHLHTLIPILNSLNNETDEFDRIHIRSTIGGILPYVLFLYGCLMLGGMASNLWMGSRIARLLRKEVVSKSLRVTYKYLLINCANDAMVKCAIVLPFSVAILVTLTWTFGSFWCYAFPLLQDCSAYWTSTMFVLIFYGRYKMASHVGSDISSLDIFEEVHGLTAFWGSVLALAIATVSCNLQSSDWLYYVQVIITLIVRWV